MLNNMDLNRLNSLTKYPSIPTYHIMGDKNRLTNDINPAPKDKQLFLTEKVDGTNVRIVVLPDGNWLIGSREEFLLIKGGNPIGTDSPNILDAIRSFAEETIIAPVIENQIVVLFFELFGGRIGSFKSYTIHNTRSWRCFDILTIPNYDEILSHTREWISSWRQHGKGQFLANINPICNQYGIQTVPYLGKVNSLPTTHEETLEWLKENCPSSKVKLDNKASGNPEGVVVRTEDRSYIVKIRYQDINRAIQAKKGQYHA